MLTVAVRNPPALGSNVTTKVVVPPPLLTGVPGMEVTVKSPACAPPITTGGVPVRFRAAVPELVMVKLLGLLPLATGTLPKSVSSVAEGVASPSLIETPRPETSISGAVGPSKWLPKSMSVTISPEPRTTVCVPAFPTP